jgi:hypothetical protein
VLLGFGHWIRGYRRTASPYAAVTNTAAESTTNGATRLAGEERPVS